MSGMPAMERTEIIERFCWYTPGRVRFLLAHLIMLEAGRFPTRLPTEDAPRRQRSIGWPAENAIVVHADLTRAMSTLPWFTQRVISEHTVAGRTVADVARALNCDWETVTRHEARGIAAIARELGWDGREGESPSSSPTIWRRDE